MRNSNQRSNERSNERARTTTASTDRDLRSATAEMAKGYESRIDKIYERARADIQAKLEAAGADRSPVAQKAAEKLDAMRAEQTARLREATGATSTAGKGVDRADDPMSDLKKADDALAAAWKQAVDESVQVRDALSKEIADYKDRRADASVDQERVADLKDQVEEALERNRTQQQTIETARGNVQSERNAQGPDAERRNTLERVAAELDRRADVYRTRADAIANVSNLLEQGRVDLAERFLDAVKRADGSGRRRARSQEENERDEERVQRLRDNDKTRDNAKDAAARASQFAILDRKFSDVPPVKQLWEEAAKAAKQDSSLEGRELYNRAMNEFKKRLVNEQDETARQARAAFEKDGFRFTRDGDHQLEQKLPMLNDQQLERKIDMARHADLLRISGQHLTKLKDGGDPVAADNLSFMIARDNMLMDVRNALSDYVRQRVVEELQKAAAQLKDKGVDANVDADREDEAELSDQTR